MDKITMDRSTNIEAIKSTMQAVKTEDGKLQIIKQQPAPEPIVETYDKKFLLEQIGRINAQKLADDNARDAELDEVNALLDLCDEVGID